MQQRCQSKTKAGWLKNKIQTQINFQTKTNTQLKLMNPTIRDHTDTDVRLKEGTMSD
jgi:peptide deformylase